MKTISLLSFIICLTCMMTAQTTAMFKYDVQLNTTDSIFTSNWISTNPVIEKEKEIINKYSASLLQDVRQYISEEKMPQKDIRKIVEQNLTNEYKDNFHVFAWNSYKYSDLFHSTITIKGFRDALFARACDILCDLIKSYPKDYKTHLVNEFTSALNFINEVPNHHYEIKEDLSYSWKPLTIFVDGKANHEICYGIKGFLLRRIYLNKISHSEIKEKITILLTKIKEVDNSKNASILCCYTINKEIVYCISATKQYFASVSNNKTFVPYQQEYEMAFWPNLIQYRINHNQGFYIIENSSWSTSDYKKAVVDKYLNIIHRE